MTFFYNNFSLHCKLKNKGFEPEVSEDEFFIEFELNDSRLKNFFEIIKTHLGEECPCKNPSCMSHYQFIYNTLQEIENERTQDELYDLFLNG